MSYVPYFFIGPNYSTYSFTIKQGTSLLSTTAMAIGANIIAALEGQGSGVRWSNVNTEVSPGDPMTFGVVLGLLFWDTILYLLLTWYIEAVFPGEFGIPRPWYFFLTKVYWCGETPVSEESIPLLQVCDGFISFNSTIDSRYFSALSMTSRSNSSESPLIAPLAFQSSTCARSMATRSLSKTPRSTSTRAKSPACWVIMVLENQPP